MDEKKQQIILFIFVFIALLIFFVVIYAPKSDTPQLKSTLDLNPTSTISSLPSTASATLMPEEIPFAWETYTNDDYSFTIDYPEKWYKQEYITEPKKGVLVAFSPIQLPCQTCTYLHDGYFSVRVYNKETNPEAYTHYTQRLTNIGKIAGYQQVQIGSKKGVWFENIIAVENNGWVYEISLDKDKGKGKIDDAMIFKKVFSTFRFTNLEFNY